MPIDFLHFDASVARVDHARMIWMRLGAIGALLGVAAGAFGAHFVKQRVDADRLHTFEVAAQQQMFHSLGLLVLPVIGAHVAARRVLSLAGVAFSLGILLFSGSLYAYALSGERFWTGFAPVGGTLFMLGWAALLFAAFRARGNNSSHAG